MKQKIKKLFQEIGVLSLSLTIVFVLVMGMAIVKGWTEPAAAPPGGNLGAPVNTGANTQIKSGALGVGALGVGTNPPTSGAVIHAASNEDGDIESLTATNNQQTGFHGLRARGSIAGPQIVQTGDYTATFLGMAFNGSDYTTMGGMHVRLDPNAGINSGNMPSILEFATHKGSKSDTYGTQMILDSNGKLTANGDVCTNLNGGKCLSAAGGGGGGAVSFISCSIAEYTPSCTATCPAGKTIIAFGQTGVEGGNCYGVSTVSGGTLTVVRHDTCNNTQATFGASCQ